MSPLLVLSIAVLVIVIVIDTIRRRRFGNCVRTERQSGEHRDDPFQFGFQLDAGRAVHTTGDGEYVLNGGAFERRATSNVEESRTIFDASLPVTLRDAQWNRLGSAQPLVARVAMSPRQVPGEKE